MSRAATGIMLVIWSVVLWLTLAQLVLVADVGSEPFLSPRPLLSCLLLIAAPALTFVPLARWMNAPLYEVEGILGWGILGFTVAFVDPATPPTLAQFLFFLVSLTVALATLCTLVAWLVALHQQRGVRLRRNLIRARRQGYLGAFSVVALLLLHGAGTLTPMSVILLLAVVVLGEILATTVTGPAMGEG
jgi:hypothetical protein